MLLCSVWEDGGLNPSPYVGSMHDAVGAPLLPVRCVWLELLHPLGSRCWRLPYHCICWPMLDWPPAGVPPLPPFAACRVGEATNPGPSAPSSWPFTPLDEGQELRLQSEPAQASSTSGSGPSDAMAALVSPDTMAECPGESSTQSQEAHLPTTLLTRVCGHTSRLKCRFVHSIAAWRWSLPGEPRLTSDNRTSPYLGLTHWYDRHSHLLDDASREEVIFILSSLQAPSEPHFSQQPHLHGVDDMPHDSTEPLATSVDPTVPVGLELHHSPPPLPSEAACAIWLREHHDMTSFLSPTRATQRNIPKSSLQLVTQTLATLWTCANNGQLGPNQRQMSQLLILLAPAWLWPEPPKPAQKRLPPQARPKLIKEQARHFAAGEWLGLLDAMSKGTAYAVAERHEPGLVTNASAQRWLHDCQQGKLCGAWRMLISRGIAAPTAQVVEEITHKWQVQPQPVLDIQRPPAANLVTGLIGSCLESALLRFRNGRTRDGLGWTQATFKTIIRHELGRQPLTGLIQQVWLGECSPLISQVFSMTRSVGLIKNSEGSIRPISIPSCFRKLQSTLLVLRYGTLIRDFLQDGQFGAALPNGVCRFSQWAQTLLTQNPRAICVQTDVSNAFGSMLRSQALAGLHEISDDLATLAGAWLTQPACTLIEQLGGACAIVTTTRGIPQGDPFSTHAFCVGLKLAQRRFEAVAPPSARWGGYVDDTAIICDEGDLPATWDAFVQALAPSGLSINEAKTRVWSPQGHIPHGWQGHAEEGGLQICGYPVWDQEREQPREESTPLGTSYLSYLLLETTPARLEQETGHLRTTGGTSWATNCCSALCPSLDANVTLETLQSSVQSVTLGPHVSVGTGLGRQSHTTPEQNPDH